MQFKVFSSQKPSYSIAYLKDTKDCRLLLLHHKNKKKRTDKLVVSVNFFNINSWVYFTSSGPLHSDSSPHSYSQRICQDIFPRKAGECFHHFMWGRDLNTEAIYLSIFSIPVEQAWREIIMGARSHILPLALHHCLQYPSFRRKMFS